MVEIASPQGVLPPDYRQHQPLKVQFDSIHAQAGRILAKSVVADTLRDWQHNHPRQNLFVAQARMVFMTKVFKDGDKPTPDDQRVYDWAINAIFTDLPKKPLDLIALETKKMALTLRIESIGIELPFRHAERDFFRRNGVQSVSALTVNQRRLVDLPRLQHDLPLQLAVVEKEIASFHAKRTRRKFLAAGAAGAVAAVGVAAFNMRNRPSAEQLPSPIQGPGVVESVEAEPPFPTDKSIGRLYIDYNPKNKSMKRKPNVFDINTGQAITDERILSLWKWFEITGYSSKLGIYEVATDAGKFLLDSRDFSIITDIGPLKEVLMRKGIGFKCNEKDAVNKIAEIGASNIRIDIGMANVVDIEKMKDTVKNAIKYNLHIDLVFNPQRLEDNEILRTRLDRIFELVGKYKNVSYELGNEPDDKNVLYWDNRDLNTFAQFVKNASDMIWAEKGREARVIVAAMVGPDNVRTLFNQLKSKGARLSDLYFALHAYDLVSDLEAKFTPLRDELNREKIPISKIIATELGTRYSKEQIAPMILRARQLGISETYVFQMVDSSTEKGFGFVFGQPTLTGREPISYKRTNDFFRFQQFSQSLPVSSGERKYNIASDTVV